MIFFEIGANNPYSCHGLTIHISIKIFNLTTLIQKRVGFNLYRVINCKIPFRSKVTIP